MIIINVDTLQFQTFKKLLKVREHFKSKNMAADRSMQLH